MFGDLLHGINEQLDNEEFVSKVQVEIQKPLTDDAYIDETFQTLVTWKLDIEARSWGIKDINVSVTRDVQIAWIEVGGNEQQKDYASTLPAGLITVEMESRGSGIYPTLLEVKLNQKNVPVSAVLTVAFAK